jgi:cytochrome P450
MLSILILALVLPAIWLFFWLKNFNYRKAIDQVPGPRTDPLVGNALQTGKRGADLFRKLMQWATEFDTGVYRIWLGHRAIVIIYRADMLEAVMSSTKNSKKSIFYKFLQPWLQDGLLLSYGPKWQQRRKLLTPTFHYSILEDFLQVFELQSKKLLTLLDKKSGGPEFDIFPYIANCALDIICMTAMGIDIKAQEQRTDYVDAVYRISTLIIDRLQKPWLYDDTLLSMTAFGQEHNRTVKILHGFTRKVITSRWNEHEAARKNGVANGVANHAVEEKEEFSTKKRLAFLDLLVKTALTGGSLTINDIQEEVDTFMFEGHDTTTSSISWALYYLGRYPDCQQRLREEIQQHIDMNEPLTISKVGQLDYMDCFLKESIRLHTTVPYTSREVTDECKIGPYDIPKGATIWILYSALHRDPKYFPDPEKFDPDRWMTDDIAKRHPFSYAPFSAGTRNCIGQRFAQLEEKTILCYILTHFNISCNHNLDDLEQQDAEMILRPANGLFVQLSRI